MPSPADPTSSVPNVVVGWIVAAIFGGLAWLFGWMFRRNIANLDREIATTKHRIESLEKNTVSEAIFKAATERHEVHLAQLRVEVREDFKSVHERLDKIIMAQQAGNKTAGHK